jgi:hypothetical protein
MVVRLFWLTRIRKVKTSAEVEGALTKLLGEYEMKPIAVMARVCWDLLALTLEADRAAFYNTYKAGYNPHALTTVLKRMARQQKEEMGSEEYDQHQFLILLFGNHPPTAQRSIALSWESNFVKMPAKDFRHNSSAFNAMKLKIAAMSKED